MSLDDFKAKLATMNLTPKSLPLAYALALCIGGLGLQQLYLGKYKSWLWRFGFGWLVIALATVINSSSLHFLGPVWFLALIWLFLNVVTDWLTLWRQVLKVNERINQGK